MASDENSHDWIWWAIPLLLVVAGALWLMIGDDGGTANFGYEVD